MIADLLRVMQCRDEVEDADAVEGPGGAAAGVGFGAVGQGVEGGAGQVEAIHRHDDGEGGSAEEAVEAVGDGEGYGGFPRAGRAGESDDGSSGFGGFMALMRGEAGVAALVFLEGTRGQGRVYGFHVVGRVRRVVV